MSPHRIHSWRDLIGFYPITVIYLCVTTTIILALLIGAGPLNCTCRL